MLGCLRIGDAGHLLGVLAQDHLGVVGPGSAGVGSVDLRQRVDQRRH
jgi:hypothetical protein